MLKLFRIIERYFRKRNDPANPFNFFVEYDFRYLDDTYLMPENDGNGSQLEYLRITVIILGLTSSETLYDEYSGSLKKEARSYTEDYDLLSQNHLLREMVTEFNH